MPQATLHNKKITAGMFRIAPIKLDANGDLPTRIPIFITGNWPNSVKGDFTVTLNDLKELKEHFDGGIGFPTEDASTGLAIDFMHEYDGPAAAWIRGLELEADDATGKGTLYASPVEWSDEGKAAVTGGSFKCISPMGAFGSKDGQPTLWQSVTDLSRQLANVLEGAGLTNIPFLQGMSPIRASATADGELDEAGMVFVKDNKEQVMQVMNLDAIVLKENKDVTAEERQHLIDNKDKLSTEVLNKFGIEAPAVDTLSAEDKELLAAIKSGSKKIVDATAELDTTSADDKALLAALKEGKKKVIDAAEVTTLSRDALSTEDRSLLDSLKSGDKKLVDAATAQQLSRLPELLSMQDEYLHDKAKTIVLSHVKRGAVKPDQVENWTGMLLNAQGDTRKSLEESLAALPSNDLLAAEVGHQQEVAEDIQTELKTLTLARQKEAKDAGRELTYGAAQNELLSANKDLKERLDASRAAK